jgi:hypothetical protein
MRGGAPICMPSAASVVETQGSSSSATRTETYLRRRRWPGPAEVIFHVLLPAFLCMTHTSRFLPSLRRQAGIQPPGSERTALGARRSTALSHILCENVLTINVHSLYRLRS